MRTPRLVLQDTDSVRQAHDLLIESNLPGAPVADPTGLYVGTVSAEELERAAGSSRATQASISGGVEQVERTEHPENEQMLELANGSKPQGSQDEASDSMSPEGSGQEAGVTALSRIVDATSPTVQLEATLDMAFDAIQQSELQWAPILDRDRHVVGTVSVGDIVNGYRKLLQVDVERLERLPRNLIIMEERLAGNSPLVGQSIKNIDLPGVAIVSIEQEGNMFFAEATMVLKAGDIIRALARADIAVNARSIIRGEGSPAPPPS
ncbi:MAG: CBS domain-containing protein [Acidimicrobiales bacterium]